MDPNKPCPNCERLFNRMKHAALAEGWISVDEVANVFGPAIRRLDSEILPPGSSANQKAVVSFFESIKYDLYKRAVGAEQAVEISKREQAKHGQSYNVDRVHKEQRYPESHETGEYPSSEHSAERLQKWKEATRLGRMHTMEGLGSNDG